MIPALTFSALQGFDLLLSWWAVSQLGFVESGIPWVVGVGWVPVIGLKLVTYLVLIMAARRYRLVSRIAAFLTVYAAVVVVLDLITIATHI